MNIKPRYIKFDSEFVQENGFKSNPIHSWKLLSWGLKRHFKIIFTQKWWNYKSWKKQKDTAVCPKCNSKNWDID